MRAWQLARVGTPWLEADDEPIGVYTTRAQVERALRPLVGDQKVVVRECAPDRVQYIVKAHETTGPDGFRALVEATVYEATYQ